MDKHNGGESHPMTFACAICCSFSTTLAPTACQNLHNRLGVDATGNWARVYEELVGFASIAVFGQYRDGTQHLQNPHPQFHSIRAAHLRRA